MKLEVLLEGRWMLQTAFDIGYCEFIVMLTPVMQMTGRFSAKAPATALMALSPPTVKVTARHPTPASTPLRLR